jgi:hypothetical protein
LTINEGFKPKDFIEITTDLTSQNGERLIIQLSDNFYKPSSVTDKKKIVVSIMKGIIDSHPFLKAGALVMIK